ncbi:hypothetical protein Hanom_Chr06g00548981 [Helianthus anomalus]
MAHALPSSHRFMNFALDPEMFDDQFSLSIYGWFFGSAGILRRVNALRDENERLLSDLKTFRTVAAEIRCMVIDAEKKFLERERAWEWERGTWLAEKERLLADVKHYKEEDSQKLVTERHWLLSQGDVGYQAGLKDGYSYSSQGLKRRKTP